MTKKITNTCHYCHGTGAIGTDLKCPDCNGSGYLLIEPDTDQESESNKTTESFIPVKKDKLDAIPKEFKEIIDGLTEIHRRQGKHEERQAIIKYLEEIQDGHNAQIQKRQFGPYGLQFWKFGVKLLNLIIKDIKTRNTTKK